MWLILLGLHVIGLTGYNLLLRKSLVKNVDRWTLATVMQTGIALPMLFALFISPPSIAAYSPLVILQIVITSALVIALHITNVKALQYLEAGVYAVLYNLRIIFATILGVVFLAEAIILLQVIGGVFVFLSVFLLRQKGKRELTILGIQWGLAASLAISFLNLFEKSLINQVEFLPYAIPVMLLAAIMMWVVLFLRKPKIIISTFISSHGLLLMSLRTLSAYGAVLAMYYGASLSTSTYISSLSVVTTVLFGIILLKERDYLRRKIIATLIAVIGFTLILFVNL